MTKVPNEVSIIIFIQMYRKRQNYILRIVLSFFLNIDFQRSKGWITFCEKIITLIIFHPIFNERSIG